MLFHFQDVFADKLNPMELTVTFSQPEVPYARPNPGEPLLDINTFPILSTEGTAGAKANTISTFVSAFIIYSLALALRLARPLLLCAVSITLLRFRGSDFCICKLGC